MVSLLRALAGFDGWCQWKGLAFEFLIKLYKEIQYTSVTRCLSQSNFSPSAPFFFFGVMLVCDFRMIPCKHKSRFSHGDLKRTVPRSRAIR